MTLISYFLIFSPLCALLCKLSGMFVTAWCWWKQQQAELWIANVPWGGRPRFDILNKLQIRQAGRGSMLLLISLPSHSEIWGPVEMEKFRHFLRKDQDRNEWVFVRTLLFLIVMLNWAIDCGGKGLDMGIIAIGFFIKKGSIHLARDRCGWLC